MTISTRVRQEFYEPTHCFVPSNAGNVHTNQQLIRIPPTKRNPKASTNEASTTSAPSSPLSSSASSSDTEASASSAENDQQPSTGSGQVRTWTAAEHERFLEAIEKYPRGPWKSIASYVGNKTARQVMSHAQKYRQKIARRKRGLQLTRRRRKNIEIKTNEHQEQQCKAHGAVQADAMATPSVTRPASPAEVSMAATMQMNEAAWFPATNAHVPYQYHLLQHPQHYQHQLHHLQPHAPVHQVGLLHYHQHHHYVPSSSQFAGSYTELLHHSEDPELILNSVGDFVENFRVDQLVPPVADISMFHDNDLDLMLRNNSFSEQLIV